MATRAIIYPQEGMDERTQDTTIGVGTVPETYQRIDISQVLNSFVEVVRQEMRSMEERLIERIDYRISELIERRNIEQGEDTEEVTMLRSISREQAKEEIMELLDKSDKLYYSDIAEKLKLDLKEVVEIIEELEAEGEVGEAE